jgi:hypothetical protein
LTTVRSTLSSIVLASPWSVIWWAMRLGWLFRGGTTVAAQHRLHSLDAETHRPLTPSSCRDCDARRRQQSLKMTLSMPAVVQGSHSCATSGSVVDRHSVQGEVSRRVVNSDSRAARRRGKGQLGVRVPDRCSMSKATKWAGYSSAARAAPGGAAGPAGVRRRAVRATTRPARRPRPSDLGAGRRWPRSRGTPVPSPCHVVSAARYGRRRPTKGREDHPILVVRPIRAAGLGGTWGWSAWVPAASRSRRMPSARPLQFVESGLHGVCWPGGGAG